MLNSFIHSPVSKDVWRKMIRLMLWKNRQCLVFPPQSDFIRLSYVETSVFQSPSFVFSFFSQKFSPLLRISRRLSVCVGPHFWVGVTSPNFSTLGAISKKQIVFSCFQDQGNGLGYRSVMAYSSLKTSKDRLFKWHELAKTPNYYRDLSTDR